MPTSAPNRKRHNTPPPPQGGQNMTADDKERPAFRDRRQICGLGPPGDRRAHRTDGPGPYDKIPIAGRRHNDSGFVGDVNELPRLLVTRCVLALRRPAAQRRSRESRLAVGGEPPRRGLDDIANQTKRSNPSEQHQRSRPGPGTGSGAAEWPQGTSYNNQAQFRQIQRGVDGPTPDHAATAGERPAGLAPRLIIPVGDRGRRRLAADLPAGRRFARE